MSLFNTAATFYIVNNGLSLIYINIKASTPSMTILLSLKKR